MRALFASPTSSLPFVPSFNLAAVSHPDLLPAPDAARSQSLKYGSLPDTYRKQQELVKRLGRT